MRTPRILTAFAAMAVVAIVAGLSSAAAHALPACPVQTKGAVVAHSARGRVLLRNVRTPLGLQPTLYGCRLGARLHRIDNALRDHRGRAGFPHTHPTYAFAPALPGLSVARGNFYAYVQRRDYDLAAGPTRESVAGWAVVVVDLRSGRRAFSSGLASGNGQIHRLVVTSHGAAAWIRSFGLGQTGVFVADGDGVRSVQVSGPAAGPGIDLYSLTLASDHRHVEWATAEGATHATLLSGAAHQP